MKMTIRILALAAVLPVAPMPAFGATYVESANGDLSNDRLNPTLFALDAGANTLTGSTSSSDRDYLTFTVPAGFVLQSLTLNSFSPSGGLSFIGIEGGTQISVPPTSSSAAGLLGWTHFGSGEVGTDILDNMGIASNGSTGFTPPLPAGEYSLWIQETSPAARNYSLELALVAVPEPASWRLGLAGLAALALWRRRSLICFPAAR